MAILSHGSFVPAFGSTEPEYYVHCPRHIFTSQGEFDPQESHTCFEILFPTALER